MSRRLLAVLPLLLAAGCVGAERPAAPTSATVPVGRTAVLGPLRITPMSVVEDSRCPSAVVCVQAGAVRIATRIEVRGDRRTETLELDTPVEAGAGCLRLAAVEPYPVQPGSVAPADYRLTYRVEDCGLTETSL
jgi:hypothetical protein